MEVIYFFDGESFDSSKFFIGKGSFMFSLPFALNDWDSIHSMETKAAFPYIPVKHQAILYFSFISG